MNERSIRVFQLRHRRGSPQREGQRWWRDQIFGHGGLMSMTLAYAMGLAEARSCLAALADGANDFDESSHFERLLLDLDRIQPIGPGHSLMAGSKAEILARLEAAVGEMIGLGGDGLSLELLLVEALSDSDRTGCG